MDERQRLRAAKAAQGVRGLQHRATHFALLAAAADERRSAESVEEQRGNVDEAFARWSSHLQSDSLDQDGVRRFAHDVTRQDDSLILAQKTLEASSHQRALANQTNQRAEVSAAQATAALRLLRRRAFRRRDERALRALEDRVAYDHRTET